MKKNLYTLFFGIIFLMSSSMFGQAVGDIAFVAFNADGDDDFAIVALADIPANTTIYFTDNESDGSGGINSGEGAVSWVSGGSIISAGTIVVFTDASNASGLSSSIGTLSDEAGSLNLSGSGDALFAFLGTDASTPTTFLAGIQNESGNEGNLANSGLTAGTTFVTFTTSGSPDGGIYSGSRNSEVVFANYLSLIGDPTNWTRETSNGENILPIPTTAFTLSSAPSVGWSANSSNQNETNSTFTVNIPVTMVNYGGTQVDLSVSVSGGTADPADYTLNTTTLTFTANGSMNVSIDINPDADNIDETIILTLDETSTTGIVITPTNHTITIIDDECNISNVSASAMPCSGDDAQFMVTWTAINTSGTVEVDVDGNGYQTITSGGTYTITGPTTAATGVTVTVRDANETTCMATSTVDVPTCPFVAPNVVINEIDCDQVGSDANEFVELYGTPNLSLDGLVIVFYNGSDDKGSGGSFDLDGHTLDANGFFVLGSSTVPGVNATFSGATGNIQNGADVVALFVGDAADFPNDVAITQTNLIDAIAYDTNDGDDAGLLSGLGLSTQYNEDENGNKDTESIQRFPDGAANIITATATPSAINVPVELMRFEAIAQRNTIVLEWTTASEENNAYFAIERSTNGQSFEQIGMVEGNGTTFEVQEYTFVDASPANGVNYYRLKQVDTDGRFEYSKMVTASLDTELKDDVKIIPNLVKEQFNIVFPSTSNKTTRLSIYNVNGQKVQSEIIQNTTNTHTVNVNTLNQGLYIIALETNTSIINKRFVKQ